MSKGSSTVREKPLTPGKRDVWCQSDTFVPAEAHYSKPGLCLPAEVGRQVPLLPDDYIPEHGSQALESDSPGL